MPPAEKKDLSPTANASSAMITSTLETVIIFDWDDTLLASSFLSGKGYRLDNNLERSPELECQLKELEASVINVLTLAANFGSVHIVTNAETGWVQMSAQKFIPGVVPILSKVKVVSARSTYEAMFPDAPLKWKFYAFQEKLSSSFTEMKAEKNVISFGDSYVEREAVRAVTKGLSNTRTKSVKFAERPSMEQLRRQIELVSNCFQYIYNHDGDLDLQLTVTVSSNSPPNSQPSSPLAAPAAAPPSPSQSAVRMAAVASPPPATLNRVTPPTTPTHVASAAPLVSPNTPKLVPKSPAHQPGTPRTATAAVQSLFGTPSHQQQSQQSHHQQHQQQHHHQQQQQQQQQQPAPMQYTSTHQQQSQQQVSKPAPIMLPPPQSPLKALAPIGMGGLSSFSLSQAAMNHSHHAMMLSGAAAASTAAAAAIVNTFTAPMQIRL